MTLMRPFSLALIAIASYFNFLSLSAGSANSATTLSSAAHTHLSSTARTRLSIAARANTHINKQETDLCPEPALSRVTRHRIAQGETIESIAEEYGLIPATLMGMNPALRSGKAPVGTEILVPPYNGIRVEVPAGSGWRELARQYNVRADVLFEVNGCQESPTVAFIPGVNWSPNGTTSATATATTTADPLGGYPLPAEASILKGYDWQVDSELGDVVFHAGVDLAADAGTEVFAVGDGTIAFAGEQGSLGNLVVINHSQGFQTRYAQLDRIDVKVGQKVQAGDTIGTVGQTGDAPQPLLHFEVRSNSSLGWVAQDPGNYVQDLRLR